MWKEGNSHVYFDICILNCFLNIYFTLLTAFAMLEQQSDASEIYISTKDKEIYVLQAKIDEFERVKISTEEENSKLRSELNDAFQKFSVVSQELQLTKRKYEDSQEEFKNERSRLDREHASEVSKYKYTIQELSVSVKEYQSKVWYGMVCHMLLISIRSNLQTI